MEGNGSLKCLTVSGLHTSGPVKGGGGRGWGLGLGAGGKWVSKTPNSVRPSHFKICTRGRGEELAIELGLGLQPRTRGPD